jgi:hypothetical protein
LYINRNKNKSYKPASNEAGFFMRPPQTLPKEGL